ncbi:MAG: transketolase C-terminal domain-containing protein [Solidesulfovibrio sp.]|uniref:transketolase family protein n=1 Tax=Solidesulfovibrio sp. TaxID=2910990 RepID=UPI002B21F9CC|nr:transketolase C-terminal domain-containing protein [Solidesulfovibrio sp.]MEA4855665.1 transketolase C-terminal domain-containing protein [Solidesulfovibrio sp.]
MRRKCLDMVTALARRDPRVVFVGSDLGHGTLADFRREMPERFFMEGISEGHVLGLAAGLALEGFVVYVNTIATFLTRRAYEQAVLDLGLHNLPVRLIGNGGGLVYAPLGPTHLATEDLTTFRAIPNMAVICPADATEMERFMPQTLDWPGPIYIRLGKGHDPVVTPPGAPFVIGRGQLLRPVGRVLLVTTGVCLGPVLEAADLLGAGGIVAGVLHLPTVKPLDAELLRQAMAQARAVVTVEENTILGGLGGAVAEVLAEADFPQAKRFRRMGLPDVFPDCYGTQKGLWQRYGLTPAAIRDTAAGIAE